MLLPLLCKQKPLMPHKHKPPQRPQRPHLLWLLLPEWVRQLAKPPLMLGQTLLGAVEETAILVEMLVLDLEVEMPQEMQVLEPVIPLEKKRAD
jgi:hypothetical protein